MTKFAEGTLVSVKYGVGPRTVATIVSGPHKFTSWERKQAIAAKEKAGLKTDRVPNTYYRATTAEGKIIRALGGHIRLAEGAYAPKVVEDAYAGV